jgi:hypothetical protein
MAAAPVVLPPAGAARAASVSRDEIEDDVCGLRRESSVHRHHLWVAERVRIPIVAGWTVTLLTLENGIG